MKHYDNLGELLKWLKTNDMSKYVEFSKLTIMNLFGPKELERWMKKHMPEEYAGEAKDLYLNSFAKVQIDSEREKILDYAMDKMNN